MALQDTAIGVAGQMANTNPVDKYNLPADVDIPFGRLVSRTATGVELGTAAPLGVSLRSLMQPVDPITGTAQYTAEGAEGATFVRKGYIFVDVIDAVVAGDDVYASDTTGEFRATTDTGFTQVTGATFETDAAAGGVAVLRIEL